KQLGVYPNSPMIPSPSNVGSPVIYKEWLFVPTGNGVAVDHPGAAQVRVPNAPSLVCFNKVTGAVVWQDRSPGPEGYGGNHASPLVVEVGDQARIVHPQADGWVRAFDTTTGALIWKFDVNYKGAQWGALDHDVRRCKAVV